LGKSNPFIVTRLILKRDENKGERLPMVLRRESRLPLAPAMGWALSTRRSAPVAASTMDRELRCVAFIEWWCEREGLSLNDPLTFIDAFTPGRIEASLLPWLSRDQSDRKVKKLAVSPEVIRERLAVAASYIDWRLNNAQRAISVRRNPQECLAIEAARASIARSISDVEPTQSSAPDKEGLSQSEVSRLLDVIDPAHPRNPWARGTSEAAEGLRKRNQLIVMLMLAFGPRRGDILKLHTGDAKTHGPEPELWIRRRPDDPNDSRVWEPNSKTSERNLPLDPVLTRVLNDYINKFRRLIPRHKKTPYLFLAVDTGEPLATRSLNDVFESLKSEFPRIHPHVLRYTHNERLKTFCKEAGIAEEEAINHAKYLNGWLGDNSAIYTRRSRREAAQRLSQRVQRYLFAPIEDVPF
jgi:integrase